MISTKTAVTLLFIILNMHLVASTTPKDTPEPSPSGESTPLVRKRRPALKTSEVLVDATNDVSPVEVQEENTETSTSQEQPAPQRKSGPSFFETLMSRGRYDRLCYFAGKIGKLGKFLKQLCQAIGTLDKYNEILSHSKRHNLVASFYVLGDIEVVKGAIIAESNVYDDDNYLDGGDLEAALPLALDNDNHDRVTELLDIRMGITAERDKLGGRETSFGEFMYFFLLNLAPWKNGMALRRFLVLHGDELRSKHRGIFDTLCQELVCNLRFKFNFPDARLLLFDLIGQPLLLTPAVFAREFLNYGVDSVRSNFIKYGWDDAIKEGLKSECGYGGEKLWRVLQEEQPTQFVGEFPDTEEARTAVCIHFPTKQQREDQWIKGNAGMLCSRLEKFDFLPKALWFIVSEYAALLIIELDLTASTRWSLFPFVMRQRMDAECED